MAMRDVGVIGMVAVVAIVIVVIGYGLFSRATGSGWSECGWLSLTFFSQSNDEAMREFSLMSLPRKYKTYICAEQYRHPPAIEFAIKFASEGESAVPFLKEELMAATDDLTIRDIVLMFFEMYRTKSYDVSADSALMSLLEKKTHSISDPFWRNFVQDNVAKISGHK
jgi:hypothetical protein